MIDTYACEYCDKTTACDCIEHQASERRKARSKDLREQRSKADAKCRGKRTKSK